MAPGIRTASARPAQLPSIRDRFPRTPLSGVTTAVALAMIAASGSGAPDAFAGPTGGVVAPDQAKINQSGSQTVINQFANRAAIDWQSFSIAKGESVIFNQPSSAAVALNRVVGPNPSEIYGSLQANGHVFLINPSGVLFGRGAQVDVAGLVASTLNISTADFMAGRYVFSGGAGTGRVRNETDARAADGGHIRVNDGSYIAFLGNQVSNSGTLAANKGSVALAAGDAMTLDFNGDGLLSVRVNAAAAGAKIDHSGLIVADGGVVIMSAQAKNALLDTVLNVDGIVQAKGVVEREGHIYLDGGRSGMTSVAGTLDASSTQAKGGEVRVLGEYVGLFGSAQIDASGATGGGTVLVGGDFQGKNADIPNGQRTYVGPNALIKADALGAGDGGKVIVWSDDSTRFFGAISARGGAEGGNGGFVEVSGSRHLAFNGLVDAGAPRGRSGMLLLDPADIQISTGGDSDITATTPFRDATDNGGTSVLNTTTLQNQLALTPVEVTTSTSAGSAPLGGTISVLNPVTWANANSLTLTANNQIRVDAALTSSGGAPIILNAGGLISQAGGSISTSGLLTTTSVGGTTLIGPNAVGSFNATNSGSGNISLTNTAAPLTITGISQAGGGSVTVSNTGALAVSGTVSVGNGGAVNLTSTSTISESGAGLVSTLGTLTTSSVGGTTLGGANTVSAFNATNIISRNVSLTNTAAPLTITGISQTGGGSVTVNNTGALDVSGTVSVGNSATVNLTSTSTISESGAGLVNTQGTLTTSSAGGTTLGGANTVSAFNATNSTSGNISLTNTAGQLTITDISQTGGGSVTVSNTGALAVSGTVSVGNSAAVNLTSTSTISESGAGLVNTLGTLTTSSVGGTTLAGANTVSAFNATNTTSGNVSLTNTAGLLTITGISQTGGGNGVVNNTGSLSLTGALSAAGAGTFDLRASGAAADFAFDGGSVTSGSGTLQLIAGRAITTNTATGATTELSTTGGARLQAGTTIGTTANGIDTAVGTLAASGAGDIFFNQTGAVILDAVAALNGAPPDPLSGITSTAGGVSLVASGGITVAQNVSGASGVTLASSADNSIITNTAGIISPVSVALIADRIALVGGSFIAGNSANSTATTNAVLRPFNAARPINVGTDDMSGAGAAGALGLTDPELGLVRATTLTIGDAGHTAAITIAANTAPANAPNVVLVNNTGGIDIRADLTASNNLTLTADGGGPTSGAITRSTGTGTLTGNLVTLNAATGIGSAGGANSVVTAATTLAAQNSGASGNINIFETDGVDVTSLFQTDLTNTPGTISLTSNTGNISLSLDPLGVVGLSVDGQGGLIKLTATSGAIVDGNGGTALLIRNRGPLTLAAANGIGSGNAIDTSVASLSASNTSAGNIEVANSGQALEIAGVTNSAANGSIALSNFSFGLTTTGAITTAANGNISLTADGVANAAGLTPLTINGAVTAGGSGTVTLTTTGPLNDVTLSNTVSSDSGNVAITATGRIMEADHPTDNTIRVGVATPGVLTTQSNAGTIMNFSNFVGTFNATNNGPAASGQIEFFNSEAPLTVTGANNTAGRVLITNQSFGPAVSASISVTGAIVANSDVLLTATNVLSDILLSSSVTAGGDVSLTAGRNITELAGGSITAVTLAGSAGAAASFGQSNAITNLGAFTTGGDFKLTNAGSLVVTGDVRTSDVDQTATAGVTAQSGNITLTSTSGAISGAGTLTTGNATADGSGGNTTATTGSIAVNAAGNVLTGLMTTGTATVSGAPTTNTAAAGGIALTAQSVGGARTPQAIALGGSHATLGGQIPTAPLDVTTTGSGSNGDIHVSSSGEFLNVRSITTDANSAQTVDLRATAGSIIFQSTASLNGVAGTGAAPDGDALSISHDSAPGTGVIISRDLEAGSISVASNRFILLQNNLATSAVNTSATPGSDARSGDITIVANVISGNGALTTGNASANGSTGAATTARSGSISVATTGGDIAVGAMSTGAASIASSSGNDTATSGDIILNAAGAITLGSSVNAGAGAATLTANGLISGAGVVTGANVVLDSGTGVGTSTGTRVNTAATTLAARSRTSGGVFVSEANGVTLNSIGGIRNGAAGPAPYDLLTGPGAVIITGPVNTSGAGSTSIATSAGGSISIFNSAAVGNAGGATTLAANGALLELGSSTVTGAGVTLRGTGVTQGNGSVNAGAGPILVDGDDGFVALLGTLATTNSTPTAVQIVDAASAVLGNVSASGGVVIGGAGGDSVGGNVSQIGSSVISAGTLTGNAGGTVTLGNANAITNLGPFTSNGNFTLTDTTGGLTLTGAVNAGRGAVSVTTSGGALALQSNDVNGVGGVNLQGEGVTSTGGTISSTALANSGTPSGAIQIIATGNGAIGLAGSVVSRGAESNAGAASNAGNITFTTNNGPISVALVNARGGDGTGGDTSGGNAGAIQYNVGGAANTLVLNGDQVARGGDASGSGDAGSGGDLIISAPTRLGADINVNTRSGVHGEGKFGFTGTARFGNTIDTVAGTTHSLTVTGDTVFSGPIGGADPLASLMALGRGTPVINTSAVTTTGVQFYAQDVLLTAPAGSTVLTSSGGRILFGKSVSGPVNLTVSTSGLTSFAGVVGNVEAGSPFGAGQPLASLTIDGGGITEFGGYSVRTTGSQTYNDAVIVRHPFLRFQSLGAGDITFGNTLDGIVTSRMDLPISAPSSGATITTAGTTTFLGPVGNTVPLAALTTDGGGTTVINTSVIRTAGDQTYNDVVTLRAAAISLEAANGVPLGIFTPPGNGTITFGSTVDGAANLALSMPGSEGDNRLQFNGAVGSITPLASLSANTGQYTTLNGGSITTVGAQTYTARGIIQGPQNVLTSTAGGAITFSGTTSGGDLTVNTSGATTFNGDVYLRSLTTDAGGTTVLGGVSGPASVNTTGAQTYNDNVVLEQDTAFASSGAGAITFAGTIESPGAARALTVGTSGAATYGGLLGGNNNPLSAVFTNAAAIALNGGGATTTGNQTFNGPVTLGADTTLTSTNGNVSFGSTINADAAANNRKLAVFAVNGTATFGGSIGNLQPLADLDVFASPNTIVFNSPTPQLVDVSAQGGNTVTFNAPVRLDQSLTVNTDGAGGSDNSVAFNSTVNADAASNGRTLNVTSGGGSVGLGAVGTTQELGGLAVSANQLLLNGDVRVDGGGAVNFMNVAAVRLGPNVLIDSDRTGGARDAGDISFGPRTTIDSAGTRSSLTLNTLSDGGQGGFIDLGVLGPSVDLVVFGRIRTIAGAAPVEPTVNRGADGSEPLRIAREDIARETQPEGGGNNLSAEVDVSTFNPSVCEAKRPMSLACD